MQKLFMSLELFLKIQSKVSITFIENLVILLYVFLGDMRGI